MLGDLHDAAQRSIGFRIGEGRNQQEKNTALLSSLEEILTELTRTMSNMRLLQESEMLENYKYRFYFPDDIVQDKFNETRERLVEKLRRTKQFNLELDRYMDVTRVFDDDMSFDEEKNVVERSKDHSMQGIGTGSNSERELYGGIRPKKPLSKETSILAKQNTLPKKSQTNSQHKSRQEREKPQLQLDEVDETDRIIEEMKKQPQKKFQKRKMVSK